MKNSLLIILASVHILAYSTQLNITKDTILDTDLVFSTHNHFDTILINNATLTATHYDTSAGFKSAFNIGTKKLLRVENNGQLIGQDAIPGVLACYANAVIENNSTPNAIRNIDINILQNGTIQLNGNSITIGGVLTGNNNRNLAINTNVTLSRYYQLDIIQQAAMIIDAGDTLTLTDSTILRKFANYPHIVMQQGAILKKEINATYINQTDTLPFGFVNKKDSSFIVIYKLNSGVVLGTNPYLTFELIPLPHPNKFNPLDYGNFYLKISGHDISNLDFDISMSYLVNRTTGVESKLLNCYYNGSAWAIGSPVNTTNKTLSFSNLTDWGSITVIGDTTAVNTPKLKQESTNSIREEFGNIIINGDFLFYEIFNLSGQLIEKNNQSIINKNSLPLKSFIIKVNYKNEVLTNKYVNLN